MGRFDKFLDRWMRVVFHAVMWGGLLALNFIPSHG
jgi:hypothetical protein